MVLKYEVVIPFVRKHNFIMKYFIAEHFICCEATSFIFVRFSHNEVDSKLSNEVFALLVMKLCPADINEKIQVFRLGFFGRDGRI